ncbi:DUF5119 domain-containing protein [Alistipes sp. OttesenSCG-928-L06]|nr:DUF5119 domain-containing protein [Alistipes sp. OttesenSCG-928-L06]
MKRLHYIILPLLMSILAVSCKNKELVDDDICGGNSNKLQIKVVVNWTNFLDARSMRYSLFSVTPGVEDYDRDAVPASGSKFISLPYGATYKPLCYDYYATNVYFRNENSYNNIEAYCVVSNRSTYNTYVETNPDILTRQQTVGEPNDFFVDVLTTQFQAVPKEGEDPRVIEFTPVNVLRQFTFIIYNVKGSVNISESRGAITNMSGSYYLTRAKKLADEGSTVLFTNTSVYNEAGGYITGYFYTFGPVGDTPEDFNDIRFTIEVFSNSGVYFAGNWDVTQEVVDTEVLGSPAKRLRDGYDIVIYNRGELPEIPDGGSGPGSGFEIGVGDWNNVVIEL